MGYRSAEIAQSDHGAAGELASVEGERGDVPACGIEHGAHLRPARSPSAMRPLIMGLAGSLSRLTVAVRIASLLILGALVFAPAVAQAQTESLADVVGSPLRAKGDIVQGYITIGDDARVPCTFLINDEKGGSVQIGDGVTPAVPVSTAGAIHLPEQVTCDDGKTYAVNAIGASAFDRCTKITDTGLGANHSITSLGTSAFRGCTSLATSGLETNATLTSISSLAFSTCSSLMSTGLESNHTIMNLDSLAFRGCTRLASTGLDSNGSIAELGLYAFENCTSLTDTGLAKNHVLTAVRSGVFSGCSGLLSTGLGSNSTVREVGDSAFSGCTSLRETGLRGNTALETLGSKAFYVCTALESTGLEANGSVRTVGEAAFYGCTSLISTGLESNSTIKALPGIVFEGCTALRTTGLESNDTIADLGVAAFSDCKNLISTGLGSNGKISYLTDNLFFDCTSLTSTGLESNTTVTRLETQVFSRCTSLTSTGLTENRTVSKVGLSAFVGCPNLGVEPDATGQSETGDLVLNAPDGGGKLTVLASAFGATGFSSLYLNGTKDQFDLASGALALCDKLKVLYVPASWGKITSWSAGGKTFKTSDGSLVIMSSTFRFVSADRTRGTADQATVTLVVERKMKLDISGAESGMVVHAAQVTPYGSGAQQVKVMIPDKSGLVPAADQLTASTTTPIIYPEGAGARSYNSGDLSVDFQMPAVSYRIAFDANKGTGSIPELSEKYGAESALPLNAGRIARENYDFLGWSTRSDGGTDAIFIGDGAVFSPLTDIEGSTVRLYAQWRSTVSLGLVMRCHTMPADGAKERPLARCGMALSSTPDEAGEIYDVFLDEGKTVPVREWPQMTDDQGDLTLYGIAPGTYYILNLKAPAGYQTLGGKVHTFTVDETGKVSVDGRDPIAPTDNMFTFGLGFYDNPVLPSAGSGSGRIAVPSLIAAGVAVAVLSAFYLAARRTAGR